MWVRRQHVPVMVATFVAPVLVVAAIVAMPGPRAAAPGRCPSCGRPAPHADGDVHAPRRASAWNDTQPAD